MTDWTPSLKAAQAAVDAAAADLVRARARRAKTVAAARAEGLTIYAAAATLGVTEGAVRRMLGLRAD